MKPDPDVNMKKASAWTVLWKKTKKVLLWLAAIVVFILAIFIYWKYFYTYSDGSRAGLLQKFSRKGTIFKTYEGELILSSVSGNKNVIIASEKFFFSVIDDSLANRLDTLQGREVIVHYRQKNSPVFWRGDSPYLVDDVKSR
jgi:hypothetical protein